MLGCDSSVLSVSSVVYKFSCPGCSHSYIGKTDRCLYTRLKEHTTSTDAEIFKHINSCEHFSYLTNMLTLKTDESQPNIVVHLTNFLLNNTVIIDKAKHWSTLLSQSVDKILNSIMAQKHQ